MPGRLLVLGGGYVGCEMATAWHALGAEVTLLQRGDRLLPAAEPQASEAVARSLRENGVDVRLGTDVAAVRREGDTVVLTTSATGSCSGDEVLVAVGRAAAQRDIGLETVGLEPGTTCRSTRRCGSTGRPWLYGVGDVNGRACSPTWASTRRGRRERRSWRGRGARSSTPPTGRRSSATADAAAVPSVVFTTPQIASIGRTAARRRRPGCPTASWSTRSAAVAGAALFADGYTGHGDRGGRHRARGAPRRHVRRPGVAELLQPATIAVVGEVPIARLWHAVPAYPTVNEIWLRLLETYRG